MRELFFYHFAQFGSTQEGHADVGQQQLVLLRVLRNAFIGRLAVVGFAFDDIGCFMLQHVADAIDHHLVIVGQQDMNGVVHDSGMAICNCVPCRRRDEISIRPRSRLARAVIFFQPMPGELAGTAVSMPLPSSLV